MAVDEGRNIGGTHCQKTGTRYPEEFVSLILAIVTKEIGIYHAGCYYTGDNQHLSLPGSGSRRPHPHLVHAL